MTNFPVRTEATFVKSLDKGDVYFYPVGNAEPLVVDNAYTMGNKTVLTVHPLGYPEIVNVRRFQHTNLTSVNRVPKPTL